MKEADHLEKSFVYKIADQDWEFEQIYKLNYETFVNEIPQHSPNTSGLLVDKFNEENVYFICLFEKQIIGMITIRDKRPFSLESKLKDMDSYLPEAKGICEIRLLAVRREHRNTRVFYGLVARLAEYCHDTGYDLAIISGTVRQIRLYKHIGFIPFGPLVGSEDAQYQPMYLTWNSVNKVVRPDKHITATTISVLPGPVEIKPVVRKAFSECPISHRSEEFHQKFHETKKMLCGIVNAKHVEIVMGSSTLANDIVAGQLSLLPGKGIVISNGEFGDRLIDHATRIRLDFVKLQKEWGTPFNPDEIRNTLRNNADVNWLWMVHCETSTGMLNDLEAICTICVENNIHFNIDAISSIGTTPVDLEKAYLVTGVSGKGLESLAGLAMIFYNRDFIHSDKSLPRYLDLSYYQHTNGVPFTISSNLMMALNTSLKNMDINSRFEQTKEYSKLVRYTLEKAGYKVLVNEKLSIPSVITLVLPENKSATAIGDYAKANGFLLSYQSNYLIERNWIQICLMGNISRNMLENLITVMEKALRECKGFVPNPLIP
ncbi:MAG: aminotransferase class V-fold PLP-dependent enzyme [Bacteroidetes bacterium]|nr:aminotransferase class V-fold PLP-dependent enzyme [Bacteroidota bacterium]